MSNPIETTGDAPSMPGTVKVARILTFVIAGLLAVASILVIQAFLSTDLSTMNLGSNVTPADVDRIRPIVAVVIGVAAVIMIAGNVTAGILLGQRRNAGRILAWIFDGGTLLLCTCSLLSALAQPSNQPITPGNDVRVAPVTEFGVQDLIVSIGGWLAVICALVVVIMLALPASNEYFRKPEAVWTPPTYPGDPSSAGILLPPPPSTPIPPAGGPRALPPTPPPPSTPSPPATPPPAAPHSPPPPTDPTAPPSDHR